MHGQILQGVVHPAEIPFVVEAETAVLRRRRDLDVIGRILRHEHDVWIGLLQIKVRIFEEPDTRVVERCIGVSVFENELRDGVKAQTVNVIIVNPKIQRGLHEGQDVRFGVVKQNGAPLGIAQIFIL